MAIDAEELACKLVEILRETNPEAWVKTGEESGHAKGWTCVDGYFDLTIVAARFAEALARQSAVAVNDPKGSMRSE